jgi:hypothetical protein
MVPFWEQGTLTSVSDVQSGQRALLVEAKSGETVSSDAFDSLDKVQAVLETGSHQLKASKMVVHGGSDRWIHRKTTALPWGDIDRYDWAKGSYHGR